jgi:hypothetical protein
MSCAIALLPVSSPSIEITSSINEINSFLKKTRKSSPEASWAVNFWYLFNNVGNNRERVSISRSPGARASQSCLALILLKVIDHKNFTDFDMAVYFGKLDELMG